MTTLLKSQALLANVASEQGFANIRYYDDKLSVYVGDEWVDLTGGGEKYVTYGVEIDLTNSDPSSWATYTDDAIGMEAGSSAFDETDIFGNIQSYTFSAGAEVKALSKTDCTQYVDGTSAATDISSGAYDVMTKFTRGGYKIWHSDDGSKLYIQVTNNPNADGFCYKAFQRGSTDVSYFYLGRYLGYNNDSKLRSYSGVTPTGSVTIGDFRTYAHNNGSGYEQIGFYQLTWVQCLYAIKYKMQNSQVAIGRGYVDSNSSYIATGGSNGKGDTWGETTGKLQMVLFGLEDFWGNKLQWVDGIVTDSSYNILTGTDNFNDTGSGYDTYSSGLTTNISGYIKDVQGTNNTGFVLKANGGNTTTYFCDIGYLVSSCVAYFGGVRNDGTGAGAFLVILNSSASYSRATVGARSMFLPTA